jgi:hypothetical protein
MSEYFSANARINVGDRIIYASHRDDLLSVGVANWGRSANLRVGETYTVVATYGTSLKVDATHLWIRKVHFKPAVDVPVEVEEAALDVERLSNTGDMLPIGSLLVFRGILQEDNPHFSRREIAEIEATLPEGTIVSVREGLRTNGRRVYYHLNGVDNAFSASCFTLPQEGAEYVRPKMLHYLFQHRTTEGVYGKDWC